MPLGSPAKISDEGTLAESSYKALWAGVSLENADEFTADNRVPPLVDWLM